MILILDSVLGEAQHAEILRLMGEANFVDGRETAAGDVARVKDNRQVALDDPRHRTLTEIVEGVLRRHPIFGAAALPKRFVRILFSRYDSGMGYGLHIDNPIIAGLRADVSFTLFLSEPDAYEGGALTIKGPTGFQRIKLPARSLVLYASSYLHEVQPVTRGTRYAAVGWVRSLVRDPARREVLFDLARARQALADRHGPSDELALLANVSSNLMRFWVED